jgi:hypothetical protein
MKLMANLSIERTGLRPAAHVNRASSCAARTRLAKAQRFCSRLMRDVRSMSSEPDIFCPSCAFFGRAQGIDGYASLAAARHGTHSGRAGYVPVAVMHGKTRNAWLAFKCHRMKLGTTIRMTMS